MGYSTAKVSTHLELEKNRGYWRFYDENHKQVKAEPILYTLLKTII
ncbi:hypothetical protein [Escherichia coli]|nr:hypothetical protein [Escherichia coli]